MYSVKDFLTCSGVLLRHGLFVTGKHCFWKHPKSNHDGPDWTESIARSDLRSGALHFSIGATLEGATGFTVHPIWDIIADGPGNNIAYVTYDPKLTFGKIEPVRVPIVSEYPVPGTGLRIAGFRRRFDPWASWHERIVGQHCQTIDHSDYMPGLGESNFDDVGYDGLLFDTNCPTAFDATGGPVFEVDPQGRISRLAGILGGTFKNGKDGSPIQTRLAEDELGGYLFLSANFSSFASAHQVDQVFHSKIAKPNYPVRSGQELLFGNNLLVVSGRDFRGDGSQQDELLRELPALLKKPHRDFDLIGSASLFRDSPNSGTCGVALAIKNISKWANCDIKANGICLVDEDGNKACQRYSTLVGSIGAHAEFGYYQNGCLSPGETGRVVIETECEYHDTVQAVVDNISYREFDVVAPPARVALKYYQLVFKSNSTSLYVDIENQGSEAVELGLSDYFVLDSDRRVIGRGAFSFEPQAIEPGQVDSLVDQWFAWDSRAAEIEVRVDILAPLN